MIRFCALGIFAGPIATSAASWDSNPFGDCESVLASNDPPADIFSLPIVTTTVGAESTARLVAKLRKSRRLPIEVSASATERRFVSFFHNQRSWGARWRVDFVWKAEDNFLEVLNVAEVVPQTDGALLRLSGYRSIAVAEGDVLITRAALEAHITDGFDFADIVSSLRRGLAPPIPHDTEPHLFRHLGRSNSGRVMETIYHVDSRRRAVVVYAARDAQLRDHEDFEIDWRDWDLDQKFLTTPSAGSLQGVRLKLVSGLPMKLASKHLLSTEELNQACADAPELVKFESRGPRRFFVKPLPGKRFLCVVLELANQHAIIVTAYCVRWPKYEAYRQRTNDLLETAG